MGSWLAKIIPPQSRNLPARLQSNFLRRPPGSGKLPNATIIYGCAAAALFVVALSFLLRGHWFTAILVLLPAACLLGFALQFLKHTA